MDFSIKIIESGTAFHVQFIKRSDCDAVARLEFCSRLLYKLKPNSEAVWQNTNEPRVDAYILGFPKDITWDRIKDNILVGNSHTAIESEYIDILQTAISSIIGQKKNEFSATEYKFSIFNNTDKKLYNYTFNNRSRPIVAFCVLWDGEDHARDNVEVWRDHTVPYLADFPIVENNSNQSIKTYGDPSKCIDELRNQGFPRDTDQSPRGPSLRISRSYKYNTTQEHYQLIKRTQSEEDRVGRSQIPERFKRIIFEESGYICNNCGQKYEYDYLAPDHRVPSIVRGDNLTSTNFKSVLQTLCVRCNQVKRESCKKCPYEHRCDECAWAYPDKFNISKTNLDILKTSANKEGININQLIEKYISKNY